MSSEGRRRSSRISELEARNAQRRRQKEGKMTLDFQDQESKHKGGRRKVKTRPMQDLISDHVDGKAHVVEPQVKKLLSDAFRSVEHRIHATTPMDPRAPLPDQSKLELLLDILQRRDSKNIFAEPVDPVEVEGYQDVIADPMDLGTIGMKLSRGKYNTLEDFEHDVFLVFDNALKFNQSSTVYYRQARAIREVAEKLFHVLRTDPKTFESPSFAASFRCNRWTKAEARLLNSRNHKISSGTKGKRNEDSGYQRRQTYQPPAKEKSLASDVHNNRKTLIEAKEEFDYKESVMRYIHDLGPMAKFVAMRNLSQISPQCSVSQNEVSHMQMQGFPYDVANISQGPFHQVAAARSVDQSSVQQNAVAALTDFSCRNPTKPHLKLHPQSGNFYGGNVLSIGGMNRSEDPRSIIPEASRTLVYPTHQTGQTHYMNKGLDIGNDSERSMTVRIPYSSSFYKPVTTTLHGNPNPFATWNIAPDSHGSSFYNMMQDAMRTDGPAKMGEIVSSYPGMQAITAKSNSPQLPSWQEPSLVASSFLGNDYNDLRWTLQTAPFHEESSPGLGQISNWVSPTNEGSSNGAGRLPHWLIPSNEASSTGAGPVPNWLGLGHGGGSDQVSNWANPVTSKPQFFEFFCPQQSGPADVDVMGQARIPQPQDQALLNEVQLGSIFDVQDARTRDRKGKSIVENLTPSPSPNIPRWFRG